MSEIVISFGGGAIEGIHHGPFFSSAFGFRLPSLLSGFFLAISCCILLFLKRDHTVGK